MPDDYRRVRVDDALEDHENRITANERFRLRAQGALAVIGFTLGSGFAVTLLLFAAGLV